MEENNPKIDEFEQFLNKKTQVKANTIPFRVHWIKQFLNEYPQVKSLNHSKVEDRQDKWVPRSPALHFGRYRRARPSTNERPRPPASGQTANPPFIGSPLGDFDGSFKIYARGCVSRSKFST